MLEGASSAILINGTGGEVDNNVTSSNATAAIKTVGPIMTAIPAYFAKTAVVLDPLVFGLSHPQFRSSFRHLLITWGILTATGRLATGIFGPTSNERRSSAASSAASGRFRRAAGTVMNQRRNERNGSLACDSVTVGGDQSRGMTIYPSYMSTGGGSGRRTKGRRMLSKFHDLSREPSCNNYNNSVSIAVGGGAAAAPYGSDALELGGGGVVPVLASGNKRSSVSNKTTAAAGVELSPPPAGSSRTLSSKQTIIQSVVVAIEFNGQESQC